MYCKILLGSKGSTFWSISPQKHPKRCNNRDCNRSFWKIDTLSSRGTCSRAVLEAKSEVRISIFEDLLSRVPQSEARYLCRNILTCNDRTSAQRRSGTSPSPVGRPRDDGGISAPMSGFRACAVLRAGPRSPSAPAAPLRVCLIFDYHCALHFRLSPGVAQGAPRLRDGARV